MVSNSSQTKRQGLSQLTITDDKDLSLALNYGQGTGSQQLVDFMTEHVQVPRGLHHFVTHRLMRKSVSTIHLTMTGNAS